MRDCYSGSTNTEHTMRDYYSGSTNTEHTMRDCYSGSTNTEHTMRDCYSGSTNTEHTMRDCYSGSTNYHCSSQYYHCSSLSLCAQQYMNPKLQISYNFLNLEFEFSIFLDVTGTGTVLRSLSFLARCSLA